MSINYWLISRIMSIGYKRVCLFSVCLLLDACSTLPPAFEDKKIADLSYDRVSKNIEKHKNTMVRWGGVIIDVENDEDSSLLQVLYYPLDYYGRPKTDQLSKGIFLLKSPELLDKKRYADGREIVAVGVIEAKTRIPTRYGSSGLPLINASAIHLWPIAYRDNYYGHCPSCYFQQLFWHQ